MQRVLSCISCGAIRSIRLKREAYADLAQHDSKEDDRMWKVFLALRWEGWTRGYAPEIGQTGEWRRSGFLDIGPEGDAYLAEKFEGRGFGVSPSFLMDVTPDPDVWAVVFFTDVIENADEVLSSRAELRDQIKFAAYGADKGDDTIPPLGAMVIRSAKALEEASSRHKVFMKAWEALREYSPGGRWVAIVDL